jgi:hypothetical protein
MISFAIGSKGSPVILLVDEFIKRPVQDTIGWGPGKSYNVVIFPDKGPPADARGEGFDEETLLIYLPKDQRFLMSSIYNSQQISIAVGGVAQKKYDVPWLSKAINKLQTCPIVH